MSSPTMVSRIEEDFLICIVREWIKNPSSPEINILNKESGIGEKIDWDYLIQIANGHQMLPLLSYCLITYCPEIIPERYLSQFRDFVQQNAQKNLYLTNELLRLMTYLEDKGIFAIPFKGPALAQEVYGNLALRQFRDLDILIPKKDFLKAKELLLSLGYKPVFQLSREQETVFLDTDCEFMFLHESEKVIAELHWDFAPKYFALDFDLKSLWQRLQPISLGSQQILSFSQEDLLVILCIHGTKHLWNRLQWICDIAKLITNCKNLDWEEIMNRTHSMGCDRMLYLGLSLTHHLLETGLPRQVIDTMNGDPEINIMTSEIGQNLFLESYVKSGISRTSYPFQIRIRKRLQDKWRYQFRLIFTPTLGDLTAIKLPSFLHLGYYLVRPSRHIIKHGIRLYKLFFSIPTHIEITESS